MFLAMVPLDRLIATTSSGRCEAALIVFVLVGNVRQDGHDDGAGTAKFNIGPRFLVSYALGRYY